MLLLPVYALHAMPRAAAIRYQCARHAISLFTPTAGFHALLLSIFAEIFAEATPPIAADSGRGCSLIFLMLRHALFLERRYTLSAAFDTMLAAPLSRRRLAATMLRAGADIGACARDYTFRADAGRQIYAASISPASVASRV